jgi:hypothetical protein
MKYDDYSNKSYYQDSYFIFEPYFLPSHINGNLFIKKNLTSFVEDLKQDFYTTKIWQ